MDSAEKLWSRFEKSGRLSDYLEFVEARRRRTAASKEERRESPAPDQSSL